MVHWDLPRDPIRLEQRIGRLDRIGRDKPVEIVYFRCDGERPDVARLYEGLGLFATPSAGIDAALGGVERALAEAASRDGQVDIEALERAVQVAREGTTRAAPRVFYPDAYDPSKAEEIMALVPSALDRLTRDYCVAAARDLGLKVLEKGGARYYLELELGVSASMLAGVPGGKLSTSPLDSLTQRVESLPGVGVDALPGYTSEVRFLGTFDREDAIQNQSLAFFASGQMLVEGLLLELEDGMRGRAALFELRGTGERGAGLLCVYKDGPRWAAVVVDARGRLRPEWADMVIDALPEAVQFQLPDSPTQEWTQTVRELGAIADGAGIPGRLNAAAFFRLV